MTADERKEQVRGLIFDTTNDLVSELLYYGRKEDEDLDRDTMEQAIKGGWITPDEVIECFSVKLREKWQEWLL